jgi:hypothetical protein
MISSSDERLLNFWTPFLLQSKPKKKLSSIEDFVFQRNRKLSHHTRITVRKHQKNPSCPHTAQAPQRILEKIPMNPPIRGQGDDVPLWGCGGKAPAIKESKGIYLPSRRAKVFTCHQGEQRY